MENYRAAVGHDQVDGVLVLLHPQPRGTGAIPVERGYAITGKAHDDQLYMILQFDMFETEAQYTALLLQLGVSVNLTSPVTIKGRDRVFTERKFNGIAHQPHQLEDVYWEDGFIRRVNLHITHLEQIGS